MKAIIERDAFSRRLKAALERVSAETKMGPTWLVREFNQRYQGKPVSIHAARKWLLGEALPTHDKLLAISAWLGVSPEWLLYGAGNMTTMGVMEQSAAFYPETDLALCRRIGALTQHHREFVSHIVDLLADMERLPER